jgi:hypothetical protein
VLWVLMRQVVGRLIIDDQVVETVADGGTSAPSRFCLKGRLVRQRSLDIAFAFSGFAALALQVVWQRLIAIHAGVDLASTVSGHRDPRESGHSSAMTSSCSSFRRRC